MLNDKGKQYADVEIPVQPFQHLNELKARTIHPDGSIVDFTGEPFEKTIVRNRDFKFLARTFTFPEVTVGSIIEYKYRLSWDPHIVYYSTVWSLQHDLYTVKQQFELRASTKFLYGWEGLTKHMGDTLGLSFSYSHMPNDLKPQKGGNTVKLDVENMPAFESEPSMPHESNFKPEVRFFYGGRELQSSEAFWRDIGLEWQGQAERFISNADDIRQAASAASGSESDPERKLRRLYARAQEVRNLSFERNRNSEESKKEDLKPNENARDVLSRGYGKHNDIARLFASLARTSGFEASILRTSDRHTRFFDRTLLVSNQLDWELVPPGGNVKLPSVVFASARSIQGNAFISKRALLVNGILFEPAQYSELRGFFQKVQTTDDEQAILKRSAVDAKN